MRITRRHISLIDYCQHNGITTFHCYLVPITRACRFRVYARGERAWRAATKFFNQACNSRP